MTTNQYLSFRVKYVQDR